MSSNQELDEINVEVFWSPVYDETGFKGAAVALSSENKLGKFDILPQHINFITLIFNKLLVQKIDGKEILFEFKRGVLEVSVNQVRVFLGI